MTALATARRNLSVRKSIAKPALPSGVRPSRQEMIARVDKRAALICKWLLRDIPPDVAYPQYKALIFTICLMERIEGNKLSGFAEKLEYNPLYFRTRLADIECNRLTKYFPVLWWDVLAQICKSSDIADLSNTLEAMEDIYRASIISKMSYILNVIAFLNNLA